MMRRGTLGGAAASVTLSIAVWTGASGCWSTHEGTGADPGADPPDDPELCAEIAAARAQAIDDCCVSFQELLKGELDCDRRRVRDALAARQCLDEVRLGAAGCEEVLFDRACREAFAGSVAEGEACGYEWECEEGLRCVGARAVPASCEQVPDAPPLPDPSQWIESQSLCGECDDCDDADVGAPE